MKDVEQRAKELLSEEDFAFNIDLIDRGPDLIRDLLAEVEALHKRRCIVHCRYCCPGHDGEATSETCRDVRCVDMRRMKAAGSRNWLGEKFMGASKKEAMG